VGGDIVGTESNTVSVLSKISVVVVDAHPFRITCAPLLLHSQRQPGMVTLMLRSKHRQSTSTVKNFEKPTMHINLSTFAHVAQAVCVPGTHTKSIRTTGLKMIYCYISIEIA
jgi:hypothetical protein